MTELVDQSQRDMVTGALDRTLFVEAGAGSGKTTALVDRIVNLVDVEGVPVGRIAAITFTEAAARELRTRVRDALEERSVDALRPALGAAAAQVEAAAFSTVHGFALRILADHPIEAGLPPGFGVVDEISSTIEFDESWRIFTGRVGDDMALFDVQERAAALRVDLRHFAEVARRFDDNWDLLDRVGSQPPVLSDISFDDLLVGGDELRDLASLCAVPDDRYLIAFESFVDQITEIAGGEPLDQIQAFLSLRPPPRNRGRKASWRDPGLDEVRTRVAEFLAAIDARIDQYRNEVMEFFITLVADFVRTRVANRQKQGELAYHDLLVLARRLLRSDELVRRTLHQRYTRILLDEFQDTDPIQIELAVLLAANEPVGSTPWTELAERLEPGRVVVVGDPKQSIYRFRRADVGVYSQAEAALVDGPVRLSTNFRSVPGILEWVNDVFGRVIGPGDPGRQPPYGSLAPSRDRGPGHVAPVTVLGGPHERSTKVRQIRQAEAGDVAAVICRVMEEGWLVERDGQWLPARLSDIAVLIPSRLSLPSLESAFAATNLPFRPETNSLVYATQEVRDVLAAVRAVVDPSNSVDVVAALRSALFAIGDDELLTWKLTGHSWDYRNPDEIDRSSDGLVVHSQPSDPGVDRSVDIDDRRGSDTEDSGGIVEAFAALRQWHDARWWTEPAALIDRIVRERRLRESALAEPRPRDRWRRYRFLAEQAREFSETQGGDLHDFVEWVAIQSSDMVRVTEPIPPEPDDDAVRVLTIHGAKGLEFPVAVLAGAPTAEGRAKTGPKVIFPSNDPESRPQVTLGAERRTTEYDIHASMEEVLDSYERVRLHYVAATRARDHLIVSAHHKEGKAESIGRRTWDAIQHRPELWNEFERRGDEHYAAEPPTQLRLAGGTFSGELAEWESAQHQILARAAAAQPWSATRLARWADAERSPIQTSEDSRVVDRLDVGHDGLEADVQQPKPSASAGVAIGLAVHATLQVIDLSVPTGTEHLSASAAARFGVPDLAVDVAARVNGALSSSAVELARLNPHHRELYVAMPTGTGVVEGFIDLCIETDDGVVIVDYKTDHLSSRSEAIFKAAEYRIQGATYALAVAHITGRPVVACRFVFLGVDDVVEVGIEDLPAACAEAQLLLDRHVSAPMVQR